MKSRLPLLAILIMLMGLTASAKKKTNTTRSGLKLEAKAPTEAHDTIYPHKDQFRICGYEKAQASAKESMFVINCDTTDIKQITLHITYVNMLGETLHERTETIDCDIPAGATRSIDLKSWDKQRLWYYHGTQGRHNDYSTPYDVRIGVVHAIAK